MQIGGTANTEKKVFEIQHKLAKNPNWWETADQLAIYKRGRGIETRDYRVINPASACDK